MHSGSLVFAQIMGHVSSRCVSRYGGDRYVMAFTCADQFRCMAIAQPTCRSSLRDIGTCLRARSGKLHHMGIRGGVSRNTAPNANQARDRRIHADFAQRPIHAARDAHASDALPGLYVRDAVYAPGSPTAGLRLSLFPWARFRRKEGAPSGRTHSPTCTAGFPPSSTYLTESRMTSTCLTCRFRKPVRSMWWTEPASTSSASIPVTASSDRERSRTSGSATSPPDPRTAGWAPSAIRPCGRTASAAGPIPRTGCVGPDTATRSVAGS